MEIPLLSGVVVNCRELHHFVLAVWQKFCINYI